MDKLSPDFDQKTKNALCQRANNLCSNPQCLKPTSGPTEKEDGFVNIGQAAHIKGARIGSKRHDPDTTNAQRSNITNGIWLCSNCAKLIDSDEGNYNIAVLYTWKRMHEETVKSGMVSSGWATLSNVKYLKSFPGESDVALQLILDKPKYWEYLLTSEMLHSKLSPIRRNWNYLHEGLVYKKSILVNNLELKDWFRLKLIDLENMISTLNKIIPFVMQSWGKPGEPGNAEDIKHITDRIVEVSSGLLELDTDIYFTNLSDEANELKVIMLGWGEYYFSEIFKIKQEIDKIFDLENPSGEFTMHLIFKAPAGLDKTVNIIKRSVNR